MENINNLFTGIDVFDIDCMNALAGRYNEYDRVTLHTVQETLQIYIKIEYLSNPNHPLRQAISLHPERQFYIRTGALERECYNTTDPLVQDYVLFLKNWKPQYQLDDDYIKKDKYPLKNAKL